MCAYGERRPVPFVGKGDCEANRTAEAAARYALRARCIRHCAVMLVVKYRSELTTDVVMKQIIRRKYGGQVR